MLKTVTIALVSILLLAGITQAGLHHHTTHTTITTVDASYDLLIITPKRFSSALRPLIRHKTNHNVNTISLNLEEIYSAYAGRDNAEQIKYCIKDAVEKWNISYVLLVGGRQRTIVTEQWLLPVRYSYIEDNVATPETRFISDLYYADIYDSEGNFSSWDTDADMLYSEWYANQSAEDIMDLYPDVAVGRFACRTKNEVRYMVRKIIRYEKQQSDNAWFKRMVVIAGDTYTNNDYYEGEEITQQALDWMSEFEPVKLWTSTETLQSWRDVTRTITNGCGFVFFAGHGSPAAWGTHPPFDNSTWIFGLKLRHMPFLRNRYKLPVCVVGGCHNSMFNISLFNPSWTFGLPVYQCWSWALTSKRTGGSIATIGCTGLGYGKEDKFHPENGGGGDWLNGLFFKQYGQHNYSVLGDTWRYAISEYLDSYPIDYREHAFNDTALDAKTVQEWVLLGDPSLRIGGYQ